MREREQRARERKQHARERERHVWEGAMSVEGFVPYRPRPIAFLGVRHAYGYRLKVYAIRHGAEPMEAASFEPGIERAVQALPQPAAGDGRPGVGVVVAHRGRGADYVVLAWWARENELPTRVFLRDGDAWRPARGDESFCVWDLEVLCHERDAYVATVLGPDIPDAVEAYLARGLSVDAGPGTEARRDWAGTPPAAGAPAGTRPGAPVPGLSVRAYDPGSDAAFLRRALSELQDVERRLDPRLPAPADMVEPYLETLFQRLEEWDGKLLVAERDGRPVGYAALYGRVPSDEPDEPKEPYALLSDLAVLGEHRGRGAGRALLDAAEELAREGEVPVLRLEVMAGNEAARAFYRGAGFRDRVVQMEKPLERARA